MRKKDSIHVSDKAHMNHTSDRIYAVLSDLSSYEKWWPQAKITQLDDTKFEVSPTGPGSFVWEISDLKENEKVVLTYKGIFSGEGKWFLDKEGPRTHVTYSVSLSIENGFFKFINRFMPLHKLHSKMMKKVFRNLDIYLNNNAKS